MSKVVIDAQGLGKRYFIGSQQRKAKYKTFGETLQNTLMSPFRKMGQLLKGHASGAAGMNQEIWSLKDITFQVKQGEVVGILGRNGAGKSTLLKVLSRITEPTTGSARIIGRVGSLLEVGTGFHPELTGRENVYLNGSILGMKRSEIKDKFDEIVNFSELEKFIDTPIKYYSSGMYIRLAFAVAAHLEPEILIVDEVLAVGDVSFQNKCLGKMQGVANEGRTVLFVSHNMGAIESLCQRGIFLEEGQITFQGSIQDTISKYISRNLAITGGFADLSERIEERKGPQEHSFIQSVRLMDETHTSTDMLRMGAPAIFRLEIDFKKPDEFLEIGVGISNLQRVWLHYFISKWEGFQIITEKGRQIIEIEIPAIQLYPGEYLVDVWVKHTRKRSYDDIVHEVLQFSVMEAQIAQGEANFKYYSQNTEVYSPSHWSLKGK